MPPKKISQKKPTTPRKQTTTTSASLDALAENVCKLEKQYPVLTEKVQHAIGTLNPTTIKALGKILKPRTTSIMTVEEVTQSLLKYLSTICVNNTKRKGKSTKGQQPKLGKIHSVLGTVFVLAKDKDPPSTWNKIKNISATVAKTVYEFALPVLKTLMKTVLGAANVLVPLTVKSITGLTILCTASWAAVPLCYAASTFICCYLTNIPTHNMSTMQWLALKSVKLACSNVVGVNCNSRQRQIDENNVHADPVRDAIKNSTKLDASQKKAFLKEVDILTNTRSFLRGSQTKKHNRFNDLLENA